MSHKNLDPIEYAQFKFALIAPLIQNLYTDESELAYCKRVAAQPLTLPNGEVRLFKPDTIGKWAWLYRKGGLDSLIRSVRTDKGSCKSLDSAAIEHLYELREKYPRLNATMLYNMLVQDGFLAATTSVRSVQRFVKMNDLKSARMAIKKQETFTDIEYSFRKKKPKREEFLKIMDEKIPWEEWVGVIEPYYPKGKRGRPPMGIEKMLRMYLLQIWFNLSDPATNEWKFGMKCHIGVDAGSGLVHTITITAANEHDISQTAKLLREDDEVVYGDSGYLSVQNRPEIVNNEHFSQVDFRINRRPSSLPKVSDNAIDWERYIENRKSSVRCKVEHAFRIIKCQFGYKKTVYRGLMKNENRLYAMFACANLYALAIAGRKLSTT